ncbi:OmpA family protein [Flavobacterium proteolyticum]|uniref:OmpA family protein n=1 Tax=Flavobacterium proteolyticum TaxID=2911683 RepID=A0ABR9WTE3_9FLAO|nr:OmpA family protein [Flavobacterium proteolyticum]MBE9576896.1 OmpA family protein [Flavobacterium proteolyticum]
MKYVLLLFGLLLSAQEKASFYFDFDQDTFNPKQNELFMSWLNKDQNREILVINGYCDWYGTFDYNDTLAYKRINTVQEQLKTKVNSSIFFSENLKIKGFGERVQTRKERRYNRRVDVFYKVIPNKIIVEKPVVYDDPVVYTGQKISDDPKPFKQIDTELQPVDPEELVHLEAIPNRYENAKVGDKLVMNNLYFYDRSGIFVPESLPVMEELLQFMVTHPKVKIEIQGHICCQLGEDPEDIALVRAIAVHNYLVANDIDDTRLQYKSFGSTQPIHKIPEKNEKERNENRRVEILILEN